MLAAIKLVIYENSKVVETITKETNAQSKHMIRSLEDFQAEANAALTKMIEKCGDAAGGDQMDVEEEEEDSEDDDANEPTTPKKRKNN